MAFVQRLQHCTVRTHRRLTVFAVVGHLELVLLALLLLWLSLSEHFNGLSSAIAYVVELLGQLRAVHQVVEPQGLLAARTLVLLGLEPLLDAVLAGQLRTVWAHMGVVRFARAQDTSENLHGPFVLIDFVLKTIPVDLLVG